MEFENYSRRINSKANIENFGQQSAEKQNQNKFTIKYNEIILQEIGKPKFAQTNDTRCYLSVDIVSLPFCCSFLYEIV